MGKQYDWALMLKVLYAQGHTLSNISRVTGASVNTLSTVKQETKNPPASWHEAVELLDYWLKHTGEIPPKVGDHIDTGENYD